MLSSQIQFGRETAGPNTETHTLTVGMAYPLSPFSKSISKSIYLKCELTRILKFILINKKIVFHWISIHADSTYRSYIFYILVINEDDDDPTVGEAMKLKIYYRNGNN